MRLYVTYDYSKTFFAFLKEKLQDIGVEHSLIDANEIYFKNGLSVKDKQKIKDTLAPFSITLEENKNMVIVDKIKLAINEMLNSDDIRTYNTSDYLSEKLNYSYSHLSSLFSEATYSSIENYIILTKVDKAKDLLLHTNATLTEIAHKLNYSSVAHLSRQFKKTTGITPSVFQRIIHRRKQSN